MDRIFQYCTVALLFFIATPGRGHRALDSKPLWRIDLSAYGHRTGNDALIGFSGRFLLVYPGRDNASLIFDQSTQQRVLDQDLTGLNLPTREQLLHPQAGSDNYDHHVVARSKQAAIKEVCDVPECAQPPGKPAVHDVKYFLEEPGKPKVLLFHGHCLPRNPQFIGDDYILVFLCDLKAMVVNKQGRKLYGLPVLSFPYLAASRDGTRFAVYERDESFFHELQGTTDRIRVKVFRSSDGSKIFEKDWHVAKDEATGDGRIAVSDDGLLLALLRSHEVLVFNLPSSP
jgi:hypothetical protein